MTRFTALQKAQAAAGRLTKRRSRPLTAPSQRCGMTKNGKGSKALMITLEGANGGQGQRSRCDVAEHDRRDGEGVQLLRQSGNGVAGIFQGRQSGRRGHGGGAEKTPGTSGEKI